ncbi:MAG: spore coat protein [Deltaproteobacteria bacterium CG11_big_fil_rev_8_21_14_0_20_47_16]|nr:MAG: spore coat protein [Deltaproteobacteria bacterium CG11_big_fil_rev_8_21_14_0_20_47_16]
MKGVILAGGTGSRLLPLTKVTNKHLLPVGKKPMIYYPLEILLEAGITQIAVVTGTDHMGDVVNLLGSGKEFGARFTYKVQDEAGGIAQALALIEDFAHGDSVAVILGDNIFEKRFGNIIRNFSETNNGAHLFLKEVPDPQRFGVAEIRDGRIVHIHEKPKNPRSSYAVTGLYLYDQTVFNIINNLKPSDRGEYEITDVNNVYLEQGNLGYDIVDGWWTDAGTFESLNFANKLAYKDI